ncbi:Agnestins efflux protein AgnL12 [Fulvia fulva]|uniref:Agnestins efflux protein AgnL12 n=1 Tax=Passalora fulva TaxID=5499 RepID=A0A9Q8UW44_PASFU|nr:Agnestins efflux protein AgnL12 [Fulvia fulva]KAK4610509.1 Agnestins efflux protein AgnL12 [Fulvia fulva]KAK4610913.1 Agnestins efflux protein AgnL12 [Fulvia fulva]UJO24654.1 Agnestins efflux protein AgnL12 [Fulvia fulva]WPV22072.1 Agnestins efflux protein AgnL12 [Fulvia fulva]WPV37338.1 Agnestins efflux protein AgnL12 [Fulvia fulva]
MDRLIKLSLRSMLALAASALAYFTTIGFVNAYGVFQQYYTAHYLPDYSNFQIAWLGSFATFTLFACAAPAGTLADRYGPTIPICIGVILQLLSIFMVSLCREYYQFFLAQGVLLGISMALINIPTSTIVPKYFKRHRGLAQGISIGGSSLGGVIWPIALDRMLNYDDIGFGWSMRIVGLAMMPMLAIAILFLRKPVDLKSHEPTSGSEKGTATIASSAKQSRKKRDLTSLKKPPYILLCLGLAIANFGYFVPLFYISTYAVSLGFSENLAFYLISILNGASLFGRILPGLVADRYGHFNIMTIAVFLTGLIVFCWTTATSVAGLVIRAMAFGFISGAILSQMVAYATVLSTGESYGAGIGIGISMGSVSFTALFGTPIAGELVKYGYIALSCFSGSALMVGGVFIACSRLAQDRRILAQV